jgi:hypothetical protein
MSLLDTASLIVTPNAYKAGKLYSVVPSNGDGDFTVTRATTATRVNSEGLVELVPYNLFEYSEQFDNGVWAKQNSVITANTATAPNGTLTADLLKVNTTSGSVQKYVIDFIPINSGYYTFSIYAKANTYGYLAIVSLVGGDVKISYFNINTGAVGTTTSGTTSSIESLGDGWYRITQTSLETTSANRFFGVYFANSSLNTYTFTSDINDSFFIWGAQLVEGTEAKDYQRTETRLNIPRLDYSLGSCPNLLLEPQRTNLVLWSEQFDNVNWNKIASTITANSTTSPSGVQNADTLTGISAASGTRRIVQGMTVLNATNYTTSVYAKKGTNNFVQIFQLDITFGPNAWANFDLNNGVVGSVGSSVTATITDVGNGWYRCSMTALSILGGNTSTSIILVTSATSPRAEQNTLTTSVFLWGAQVEAGEYPTSYIPTTTASVTRNADSITRNNIYTNGLITASGGTWFVELRNNVSRTRDSSGGGIFLNTGTSSLLGNGFVIRNTGGGLLRLSVQKVINDIPISLRTTTTDKVKIAIKWNGSTADVFANGVKVVTATVFTATAMENLICNATNVSANINQMELFPTPLTDTQCIELTTL